MSVIYFDSSALVKLLVEEDGSEIASALWAGCDAAVCSRLGYPEVRAALAAAGRDHRIGATARAEAEAFWEDMWSAVRPVELTEGVAVHAGQLAGQLALRGADAVHLASALAVGSDDLILTAWDTRLRAGAEAVGLRLGPARILRAERP